MAQFWIFLILKCNVLILLHKANCYLIYRNESTLTGNSSTGKIRLLLMGFVSVDITKNGWSSAGIIPAIEMALEDVNARDDLLPGYELYVNMKDTKCDPGQAIRDFYDHMRSSPHKLMILGGGCSVSTAPVARTAPYFGLVQVSFSAASPALSDREHFPTFFRTAVSDYAMVAPVVHMILAFNWSNVATLYEQDPLFSTTVNLLHSFYTTYNITVITSENFRTDPREPLQNIKRKKARIIFFDGYEGPARKVFCEVFREGMYGEQYQWIIPGWWGNEWWVTNDTDCDPEDIRTAITLAWTVTDIKGDISGKETISGMTYDEYLDRYLNHSSIKIFGTNNYHPNGYDSVWAIALALNKTIQVIKEMNEEKSLKGGEKVELIPKLEDFEYDENSKISKLILESLSVANFHGVSGPVAFEHGERIALSEIGQIRDGNEYVRIAIFSHAEKKLSFVQGEKVLWHGEGPPQDRQYNSIDIIYIYPVLKFVMFSLTGFGVILAVAFLGFNLKNREHRHIKMSSPRLNNCIVLGCILAYLSVTLFGFDANIFPNDIITWICTAQTYCLSLAFTLAFGAMFAKTWRVHAIFTRTSLTGMKNYMRYHDIHLFAFIGCLVFIDITIITSWTMFMPFFIENLNVSVTETEDLIKISQIQYCATEQQLYWMLSLYVVKGILLIFGCFLAWETRQVHIPGLNDSKFIGMSVYNVLVMSLVGVMVSFVLKDDPNMNYAIISFCVIFSTTTTLCLIFVPKVKYVMRHQQSSAKGSMEPSVTSDTFQFSLRQVSKDMSKERKNDNEVYIVPESDSHKIKNSVNNDTLEKDEEISQLKQRYFHLKQSVEKLISAIKLDSSLPIGQEQC